MSDIPVSIRNGCDGRPRREPCGLLPPTTREQILRSLVMRSSLTEGSTIALTLIALEATPAAASARVDPGTPTPQSARGPLASCGTVPCLVERAARSRVCAAPNQPGWISCSHRSRKSDNDMQATSSPSNAVISRSRSSVCSRRNTWKPRPLRERLGQRFESRVQFRMVVTRHARRNSASYAVCGLIQIPARCISTVAITLCCI